MLQWIANLFRPGIGQDDLPCVHRVVSDGMQLRVQRDTKHCGHGGYLIELDCHLGARGWETNAIVPLEKAHVAAELLLEGARFADAETAKEFAHQYAE